MANPPQPGNVTVTYASGNDIECSYTFSPNATNPTNYEFVWGTVNNPTDPGNTTVPATGFGQFNTRTAEFLVTPSVTVYIWGKISNQPGSGSAQINYSPAPLVFTADVPGTPGTPYLVAVTGNQITVNFQAVTQPGNTSYAVIYSTTNDPGTGASNTCFLVEAPDIWGSGPFAVAQGVNVYIWSKATNDGKSLISSPPLIYNSGAAGTAPSGPTSIPGYVSASNTQLTVSFNTTGVTGTLPFTVTCGASTSPSGPFDIATSVRSVGTNLYQATTVDELDFDTLYYFQTILSNGTLPNQTSGVSAGISTLNTSKVANPVSTLVQATQITMRFTLSVTYFNPAQNVAQLRWGTQDLSPALLSNSAAVTYVGLVRGDPMWEATVYGLTPGKTYYFQGYYVPIGSAFASDAVAVTTDQGNSFDLGYMPPRGWAAPNPVYTQGVSQPWRQT